MSIYGIFIFYNHALSHSLYYKVIQKWTYKKLKIIQISKIYNTTNKFYIITISRNGCFKCSSVKIINVNG